MKYRGVDLPYELGDKLKRFSKRGVGKLYILLDPINKHDDVFTRVDRLFNDPTTLGELTKEFGVDFKLKDVLNELFNGRKRLATPEEIKTYDTLLARAIKYVDDYKVRKGRQRAAAEAKELERAKRVIAKHEGKKNATKP